MKKIKTGDGSYTFVSDMGESYHSVTGAEEEAIKKYAEPTEIAKLAKKGSVKILDVCFGIGYNSAAAIDAALKSNPECKIEIVGLELDETLFDKLKELKPRFKSYDVIKKIKNNVYDDGQVNIKLIFGDANRTIKQVKGEFDVCFFDPFSPAKHPHMWTEKLFGDVASKLKIGGVLSTYSCATHVRINMVRVGFDVKDGPCVGRRAPSTIATKL
ncbi:MAG: MnmC family methyltransferase [archaeon]